MGICLEEEPNVRVPNSLADDLRSHAGELGLDPDELGSPWSAALSSLLSFALGAVVVVLPYLFGSGAAALVTAIVLAAAALFALGAVIGMLNGRGGLRSGARRGLVVGGAALLVFLNGHVAGAIAGVRLGAECACRSFLSMGCSTAGYFEPR